MRQTFVEPDVITQYAYEHIPITKHMGITVLAVDDVQISLLAPYAPNINHRETIFGGSISSLGILAGWALLWVKLQVEETPNRLVIQSSSTNFMKPATDAIMACCQCDRASWLTFYTMLQRHGKARITLNTETSCRETIVATHTGQ
ncbi:YiiD C-terminal domain-containing protein [Leptolyngbya sp. FACHB-321]|uniref:YiiD C-terminal domain-containing protein n=1 Tax=Leptolyngbya sp. FACHB-321 TaxID=2692807 RepID=UPI001681E421|nr:YiiD C-terminal domain-containing protein [Leptolyngbya sp. FACHB-321]MBD2038744.1 YiiD C-terminal domain-containing protein [Leptolyngbya sp. FACHB-321]